MKSFTEEQPQYFTRLIKYFTKDDAQYFLDNSFITQLETIKYLEQTFEIKAINSKNIITNTSCESYSEYLQACEYYHIDSDKYITHTFESFEDDDTFEIFFNQVKKERGEEYLKLHLEEMKNKIFEGNFNGNLKILNELFRDSELAKISAWTEYDMFCSWEGGCSYEKHLDKVMNIIDFYKTWVPKYNNLKFESEDDLSEWVERNWS